MKVPKFNINYRYTFTKDLEVEVVCKKNTVSRIV